MTNYYACCHYLHIYLTGIKYMAINILCRLLLFILHTDSLGCSAASLKFIEHPLSNCDTPLSDLTASLLQQIYSFHISLKKGKKCQKLMKTTFFDSNSVINVTLNFMHCSDGSESHMGLKKVMSERRRS